MNEILNAPGDTRRSVYYMLNQARRKFHRLELKKSGHNKFANYFYFELGDFVIPAMQVLDECGLCAYISFGKELATMKIVSMDDGTFIEITSPMSSAALKGCHEVQNLGAVQTYLRRYLWVAALEIVEHDALDATTGAKGDAPIVTPKKGIGDDLPEEWKAYLRDLAMTVMGFVGDKEWDNYDAAMKEANLEQDQYIWFDAQLDSKTRAAIKARNEELKKIAGLSRA